ncbi:SDR family oxidoreductase [Spongisporangium articulatum]|uniref:SDR family oxidoreductase n=1 Tax=Spongisporangium articulatum TaxID=3362603 RepID=A0ABW8AM80_9ACTN
MRVFVTGASGWVGSALLPELISAGHDVVGLARSDEGAARVEARGATVLRGDLTDLDGLAKAAAEADGVVHLAFVHDWSGAVDPGAVDRAAVAAMLEPLEGSGKPFVGTSGTLGLSHGGAVALETDVPDPQIAARRQGAADVVASAARGIRASAVRLAPSVHGENDFGFVPSLIEIARQKGVSGYVGDGANRWTGVHRLDAGRLFRLALEQAEPGTWWHGVENEGYAFREIAEAIGRGLGVPTAPVEEAQAAEHFGWMSGFVGMDSPASHAITTEKLGWEPTQPGLLDDLAAGFYFRR